MKYTFERAIARRADGQGCRERNPTARKASLASALRHEVVTDETQDPTVRTIAAEKRFSRSWNSLPRGSTLRSKQC